MARRSNNGLSVGKRFRLAGLVFNPKGAEVGEMHLFAIGEAFAHDIDKGCNSLISGNFCHDVDRKKSGL